MKKVLTILLAVAMLASLACVGASAKVIVTDPFDKYGADENPLWLWTRPEPTDDEKLVEIDGNNWLMLEVVVEQSNFKGDEDNGGVLNEGNVLTTGTWWVDMMTEYKDGESDGGAGLWFANYGHVIDDGEADQDTYYLKYFPKESKVKLILDSPSLPEEVEEGQPDPSILATYDVPGTPGETFGSKTVLKLGFRVEAGKISAFVGDTCIGSHEDAAIGKYPSPMLLWNDGGLRSYFDNYAVGDLEELPLEKKDDTSNTDAPDTSDTAAADDTTAPAPADTNTNTPSASNGGSQTGDMAVVVLMIMVAALGSAIVVKKISVK